MRLRWHHPSALLVVLLAAAPAWVTATRAAGKGPRIEVRDIDQILADVRRARGKPVLVNVWATWCEPCKEEMPDLLRIHQAYAPKGLRLMLVSTDPADSRDEVSAYLGSLGVDFPSYLKTGKDMAFIDGLDPKWDGTIPATVLFDRAGKRFFLWSGKVTYDSVKKKLEELLAPDGATKKKGSAP